MRLILAVLLVASAAHTARAEPAEITRAKAWVVAMHDHDFAAAAATTALPLSFADESLATTDAVIRAFTDEAKGDHSVFRHPAWKPSAAIVEVVSAKEMKAKLSNDHHFVRVTIREATSSTSRRILTYLIAEQPTSTGFSIDRIERGLMAIVN